ncbi:MAG: hypothetical protein AVDCRST_MAG59-1097, partial [uncultured Thermomicrobiales bacterium]
DRGSARGGAGRRRHHRWRHHWSQPGLAAPPARRRPSRRLRGGGAWVQVDRAVLGRHPPPVRDPARDRADARQPRLLRPALRRPGVRRRLPPGRLRLPRWSEPGRRVGARLGAPAGPRDRRRVARAARDRRAFPVRRPGGACRRHLLRRRRLRRPLGDRRLAGAGLPRGRGDDRRAFPGRGGRGRRRPGAGRPRRRPDDRRRGRRQRRRRLGGRGRRPVRGAGAGLAVAACEIPDRAAPGAAGRDAADRRPADRRLRPQRPGARHGRRQAALRGGGVRRGRRRGGARLDAVASGGPVPQPRARAAEGADPGAVRDDAGRAARRRGRRRRRRRLRRCGLQRARYHARPGGCRGGGRTDRWRAEREDRPRAAAAGSVPRRRRGIGHSRLAL